MTMWIVLFFFTAGAAWAGWCNHKTFKQRMRLIGVVYDGNNNANYREDRRCLDVVTYDKHFLTMLTFRNPMKLYPQHIQDAAK